MRWSRARVLEAGARRFIALVGVVGTLTMGGFGASSRGLKAGSPSGTAS
jgi:hypothetical protein